MSLQLAGISNVYGPGAHYGTVVLEATETTRAGKTPIMRRPGVELDLLYIDDVIQGLLRLVSWEPVAGRCIVNLATGRAGG